MGVKIKDKRKVQALPKEETPSKEEIELENDMYERKM